MRASPMRRLMALACLTCLSMFLARAIRPVTALALAPADTAAGLVGRWPLNDGANPTADTSGNARHAALAGSPAFTSDTPDTLTGTALDFDGVNDYLTLGGAESDYDLNVMTVALWINVDAFTTGYQAIITKGDNSWRIQRDDGSNTIHFVTDGLSNLGLNSTIAMNDNKWHHVVAVYDGSKKYLYIDGSLNNLSNATGTITTNDLPVTVGMNNQFGSRFFDGQMDDIRVYGRALSASDVAELYAFTNSAPAAAADTYAATEDTTLTVAAAGVLANDSDPDGYSLAAALVTAPANGAIQLNSDGSFAYTPTANFSGTDTFSYMAYDDVGLDPAGYWPFDDGASPTADASGNGRTGTLLNSAAFTTTVPISLTSGNAMIFDGSDDRVDVDGIDLANRSFTVAFWAKRSIATGTNYVVGQGSSAADNVLHIGFRGSNQFTCAFWDNDLETSATYTDSDWHHWACTYDSRTRQRTIYRDGVAVASDTARVNYQGTGTLSIGSRNGGLDPFSGLVDDVRVYQRALDAAAVAATMDTASGYGATDAATVTISVSGVNDAPLALDDTYAIPQGTTLERPAISGELTTTFTHDNAYDGNMFNLTAGPRDITLTGFDVYVSIDTHIKSAETYPVAVYYKPGTYLGSEQTPAAWTLLGTADVTLVGTGNTAYLDVGGLTIPAGETYGLYVTLMDTVPNLRYANGANTYSDGYLTFTSGTGQGYPFGAPEPPGTWNGTIYYTFNEGVLANDSDAESTLTAALSSAPANGDLDLNSNGTFVYTPTASFTGQDTFSYIASDGVLTDTAVVTVTVTPAACFVETSGDSVADYASLDASALQSAADAASPGATLKVAGTCSGVRETAGMSQTLYIDQDLAIQGGYTLTGWLDAPDPDLYPTVLDAEAGGRVVRIAGSVAATLDGLQIINGRAQDGAGLLIGGRAVVTATATLFSNNIAIQDGGAIANGGSLTVSASSFTANAAARNGGAIQNNTGALSVADSSFTANTAINGTINTIGEAATSVTSSSFITNTVTRGGLYVDSASTATVDNSTFAYNQASEGGGIHSRGTLTVTHSTIAYNSASLGGAIYNWRGTLYLYNSLTGANSGDAECLNDDGTLAASVGNLIDDGTCNPYLSESPGLGALADHGGATRTIALTADSLAIDNAANATCPASDQRGRPRPQGVAGDIGAYEAEQVALTLSIVGTGAGVIVSTPPGQACSTSCTISFVAGAELTLTATPATGSTFAGWGGACSGTESCVVAMDEAKHVSATFAPATIKLMLPLIVR